MNIDLLTALRGLTSLLEDSEAESSSRDMVSREDIALTRGEHESLMHCMKMIQESLGSTELAINQMAKSYCDGVNASNEQLRAIRESVFEIEIATKETFKVLSKKGTKKK